MLSNDIFIAKTQIISLCKYLIKLIMKKIILFALILSTQFLFQSCNKEEEPPLPTLAIGDFYQGGVIFYLDGTGENGLISSVGDQGFEIEWGCPSLISFGAKGLELGTGTQNTIDIISACNTSNIAADLCDKYENDGFEDWFLPSRDELDSLYQHKEIVDEVAVKNNGNVLKGGEYWSSSHQLDNTVWYQSFNAGNQAGVEKDAKLYVRAIRAF